MDHLITALIVFAIVAWALMICLGILGLSVGYFASFVLVILGRIVLGFLTN